MSLMRPASACSLSVPPPHDWKRSGGLPACMFVVSLALNASFSRTVILTLTLGWAAMYWLAAFFQIVFSESLLAMCHQLMVTGLFELVLAAPEPVLVVLSSLPPQAATTNAATARSAATARLVFIIARPSSWLEWMPVAVPDPLAPAVGS